MPIRRVQQQSDRGSIKDLHNGDDEKFPPTPFELRVKKLYEHSLATRDQALIESLGLIAVNVAPKDPVSLYRHREYVKQLEAKLGDKLEQTKQELAGCFFYNDHSDSPEMKKQASSRNAILVNEEKIIKVASSAQVEPTSVKRSFRRVI